GASRFLVSLRPPGSGRQSRPAPRRPNRSAFLQYGCVPGSALAAFRHGPAHDGPPARPVEPGFHAVEALSLHGARGPGRSRRLLQRVQSRQLAHHRYDNPRRNESELRSPRYAAEPIRPRQRLRRPARDAGISEARILTCPVGQPFLAAAAFYAALSASRAEA